MKRIGWFALLLVSVASCVASACGTNESGDSQTNWLKTCSGSSDCNGGDCICGYCAKDCDVTVDCDGTPVVTSCSDPDSAAALALCGGTPAPSGTCLEHCASDGDCPSQQRCIGSACVPDEAVGSGGGPNTGSAADVEGFCEQFVEARCDYVERCGCGAAAAEACRVELADLCGVDGFFAGVENAVANGDVSYDAAAADALLARFDEADPLCVEEPFRELRLSSDELYSWAGVFQGTLEIGSPCNLPVSYKGGISDCREGACAPRETGGGVCIELVALGEECDASGDDNFDIATRLCFDQRGPDSDGEYESAFDSMSCVPESQGSTTLVCSRDLALGQSCHDAEACASGRCVSSSPTMAACAAQLGMGEVCMGRDDCVSGVCDFSVDPAVCGALQADGESCSFDTDCENGRCLSISGDPGICGQGLANGEQCSVDVDCASEVCRMGSCFADICGDYLSE